MLPFSPATDDALDEYLSRPTAGVREAVGGTTGDIAVLGAGGKMGFHLAWMLQRAVEDLGQAGGRSVVAVSRFGSAEARERFERRGIAVRSADLCEGDAVAALPDFPNVFFLAGMKFGTAHEPGLLERFNIAMPRLVAERFADAAIVALSTGCVYSFVTPESGGSTEADATAPVGDYAISCLGRERVFREAAATRGTRSALIRLNYAIDLRYGVLVDIAQKVRAGEPVDVTMGYVNVIWQRDALAHIVQSLPRVAAPPFVLNVTGADILRVRDLAEAFGRRFDRPARVVGEESPTAWLNQAALSHQLFGQPDVPVADMVEWIATWLESGGGTLGKPTHFETRDGQY